MVNVPRLPCKMVCDKGVCDRWSVTKLCVKLLYVKDDMCKMVCGKVVCEVMYVTDGMRQSCVLSLCV